MEDKRNNPSGYAFVITSEGAAWQGHTVSEYGEADAYGHKKRTFGMRLARKSATAPAKKP